MGRAGLAVMGWSAGPSAAASETHQVVVHAGPDEVWTALHQVSLREVPVFRGLMTARELPAILTGRRWLTADPDRPLLSAMAAAGFVVLDEEPSRSVTLGLLTRPWRPGGVRRVRDGHAFRAFDEPGWAKAVLSFRLDPVGEGVRLVTRTEVRTTDAGARRRFRAYWAAVGWGSALTRRAWLAAVKRRAEAGMAPARPA